MPNIVPRLALKIAGFVALAGFGRGEEIWRLDNLTAIGSHAITMVGAPRLVQAGGQKSLRFDGASDGVFVPAIPIARAGAFTIEVLFSPDEGGLEAQRFFHLQDTRGWRALLEIRTDQRGHWWLDTFIGTGSMTASQGVTLADPKHAHPTGRWYWVALRYSGKTMASFVDAEMELEQPATFPPFADGSISLGVRQNLVSWFKGTIREVRFHREAIAPEKMQRLK